MPHYSSILPPQLTCEWRPSDLAWTWVETDITCRGPLGYIDMCYRGQDATMVMLYPLVTSTKALNVVAHNMSMRPFLHLNSPVNAPKTKRALRFDLSQNCHQLMKGTSGAYCHVWHMTHCHASVITPFGCPQKGTTIYRLQFKVKAMLPSQLTCEYPKEGTWIWLESNYHHL